MILKVLGSSSESGSSPCATEWFVAATSHETLFVFAGDLLRVRLSYKTGGSCWKSEADYVNSDRGKAEVMCIYRL